MLVAARGTGPTSFTTTAATRASWAANGKHVAVAAHRFYKGLVRSYDRNGYSSRAHADSRVQAAAAKPLEECPAGSTGSTGPTGGSGRITFRLLLDLALVMVGPRGKIQGRGPAVVTARLWQVDDHSRSCLATTAASIGTYYCLEDAHKGYFLDESGAPKSPS